ncbi:hypothetical protein [Streptomyces sp. NPDC002599]|uniref:hypothetical protein n=1 Tax=Streptomyces sp. NPDC002599 TaxID=3154421 RepID=UPI00333077A4
MASSRQSLPSPLPEKDGSVRLRVQGCSDLERLKVWSERAVHVSDSADLFTSEQSEQSE